MVKIILIDADGVVIKKHGYFSERYLKDHGSSLNINDILIFFKNEYRQAARGKADLKDLLNGRLSKWGWKGTVDDFLAYWFCGERDTDDNLLESINTLRKQGIKVYLVSDNEKYRAEYLMENVGLKNKFDGAFFSCDLGFTKEDPEFFKMLTEKLHINPQEIVYWDDDIKNINSARELGIIGEVYTTYEEFKEKLKTL